MVPVYSTMSACALHVGLPNAIYYETARDWCASKAQGGVPFVLCSDARAAG